MTPKETFLNALGRKRPGRFAAGSATSIATTDLMEKTNAAFPEAHLDPEKMSILAGAGHSELGFDNVMPLFSVWHESAALGCKVNWGDKGHMPSCSEPLLKSIDETIAIPKDLLQREACKVPLRAIEILRNRVGSESAVVGKVFGPWTLGYHVYGVQDFLMQTLLNPDAVKKAMKALIKVTLAFAEAQIESGADALTLADHCTRDLCSPDAYRDFLTEIHQELHEEIKCPLILHICGDTADRLPFIKETGIECFHFDSKVSTPSARELAGEKMALMGGTSNLSIIRQGTEDAIVNDVKEKIENQIDIIGPECAVPLDAPYHNLKMLAEEAKRNVKPD